MIAIVADRLSKWWGSRLAVDDVSFEVEAGEVMGLLGPNGSGKTTILRILTGFLRPSSGTARVAGIDLFEAPLEARRRVGYVPEDVPSYDWMRVREFLEFMARVRGVAAPRNAVDTVIARLALGDVVRMPIGKLSRGFRQRVGIAQALVHDPAVLVLDEPTNGLDPRQIAEMRSLVRSLAGSHTILITSHILADVERMADRAAILLAGRLLAVHTIRDGALGHRLHLAVRGTETAVRACLAAVTGVQQIAPATTTGDIVTCTVHVEGPDTAEAIANALVARRIALLELSPARPDLESVFLSVTDAGPQP
jgi:ABC-2 type transport system ATP-binding protein